MEIDFKAFAERSRYRIGSSVLISVFGVTAASVLIGVPGWLSFILGLVPTIALTIVTHHRLRNANLSSGWLLLMILQVGAGPSWHLSEHVTFNLVGFIVSLVPVILGWFAPATTDRKAVPTSI